MTRLIVLTFSFISLLSCSGGNNREDESEADEVSKKHETNLTKELPEVLLAIIQDGYNPPSEATTSQFRKILQTVDLAYPAIDSRDVSDKVAKAYDLARERGYDNSFLEFAEGFGDGVQNAIESDSIYEFNQFLAIYICYQVNCDGGEPEVKISEGTSKEISKRQYKELWPFTVDNGRLRCIEIKVSSLTTIHAILFEANGKNYAINGTAKNWAEENGYSNSDEIWNSSVPIGQIIEDGLKLCE